MARTATEPLRTGNEPLRACNASDSLMYAPIPFASSSVMHSNRVPDPGRPGSPAWPVNVASSRLVGSAPMIFPPTPVFGSCQLSDLIETLVSWVGRINAQQS
jgi:hypothetical protein